MHDSDIKKDLKSSKQTYILVSEITQNHILEGTANHTPIPITPYGHLITQGPRPQQPSIVPVSSTITPQDQGRYPEHSRSKSPPLQTGMLNLFCFSHCVCIYIWFDIWFETYVFDIHWTYQWLTVPYWFDPRTTNWTGSTWGHSIFSKV